MTADCSAPQEAPGGGLLLIEELESENRQLVARISDLKQENWQQEERLNQLLGQVERLTLDNSNKSRIIEFYCMGGDHLLQHHHSPSPSASHGLLHPLSPSHHHHHASQQQQSGGGSGGGGGGSPRERITVRKVVEFIKDRGDEGQKEINRKLQRMLEETLTKNMFLQEDLERLSDEVVRLKKHLPASEGP